MCAALLAATATTSASASTSARYIRYGDSGYAVKCVQWAWNAYVANMDFPNPQMALDVDGVFGDQTLAAVKYYQRSAQVDDDGVVGPLTGNYMWTNRLYKSHPECYQYIPTKV
ncbi:peptidoglycan-binding protein [Kitasatospora sp. NPDC048194]|uniref:peptidoglycan-binding domain-containing protein n=1 Tax=Kitasatospora sp. NPDC048194 TaxID=3364045 RepID=UPI0037182386